MIRFLFRLLATIALAVAVIFAVLDATRSVAAQALVMTPFADSLAATAPGAIDTLRGSIVARLGEGAWTSGFALLLALPGFLIFGLLALFLYAIGHKRDRKAGGFAYRA